jgi:aspartate/glutamate racemase/ribosomal protein S18 acetylase RimI-like enzyme
MLVEISKWPKKVEENVNFLNSKNIWFKLEDNVKVISCLEAAANRKRLGHIGIPVFDELKTELGYFINKDKKKEKVLVHCRGNQKIDRLKISSILNAKYQRLESKEYIKGLINPFGEEFRNLLQIFDSSIVKTFQPPYTMMTNAGHFNFAVEFDPLALINNLENVLVKDIIRRENYRNYKRHKIGILTGNGPDSGMLLWKKINESVKEQLDDRLGYAFSGDLTYPEVTIESIPEMGESMQLEDRYKVTEKTVLKSIINLCNNGATLICIACNTTQCFKKQIKEVCMLHGVHFISMVDVLEEYLVREKIKSFDFIGISHVVDFEKFSAFKSLQKQFSIRIPEKRILEKIEKIAFEAKKDLRNNAAAQPLRDLLKQHAENKTIVVALTEISTVLNYHTRLVQSINIIDTLQLTANHIAKKYIDGFFNTLYIDEYKDNITYRKLGKNISDIIKRQLWNILNEINHEFIPPLSNRDSTTFTFEGETKSTVVPQMYYKGLLEQDIIVSTRKEDNSVVGFMSYIPNYNVSELDDVSKEERKFNCYYITTVGVTRGARGNGITRQFYRNIEKEVKKDNNCDIVATRTWSTNKTHIIILNSLGYEQVIQRTDQRGEGIHTVYYSKKIE